MDTPMFEKLKKLTDEDRKQLRRIMSGEADEDRIRRGDVHAAIRSLRTNPVPSSEFQRALGAVTRLVANIAPDVPTKAVADERLLRAALVKLRDAADSVADIVNTGLLDEAIEQATAVLRDR